MSTMCVSPRKRPTTGSRPEGLSRDERITACRRTTRGPPPVFPSTVSGRVAVAPHEPRQDPHPRLRLPGHATIARRIREASVYCEIHPADVSDAFVRDFAPRASCCRAATCLPTKKQPIARPRPSSVLECRCWASATACRPWRSNWAERSRAGHTREFGHAEVRARGHTRLLKGIEDRRNEEGHGLLNVWMSHGDTVSRCPAVHVIASTDSCPSRHRPTKRATTTASSSIPRCVIQPQGKAILHVSFYESAAAGRTGSWATVQRSRAIAKIRTRRHGRVILGLSGGERFVGCGCTAATRDRRSAPCIYVDTGVMRRNESAQVVDTFRDEHMGMKLDRVDGTDRFLEAIIGVTDPEQKRKIIGSEAFTIFEDEATKLPNARWLAQGTHLSRRHRIGRSQGPATTIKSHHNVGGLPEKMNLKLLEPLRELFKDEVREIGPETRAAPRDRSSPSVPGPRPRRPHPRRSQQGIRGHAAPRRRTSSSTSCGRPARITGPARPLPCCCRCRASASWATVAPTNGSSLRAVRPADLMTAHWAPLPHELLAMSPIASSTRSAA